MYRISQSSMGLGLFALASLTLGFGCHVIAGIEDRGLADGGGGASSSSADATASGSATSSSSGGGSGGSGMGGGGGAGGGPTLMCNDGPPKLQACMLATLCNEADLNANGCHCGGCDKDCGESETIGCQKGICTPKLLTRIGGKRIYRAATNGIAVYFAAFANNDPRTDIHFVPFEGAIMPPMITKAPIDGHVYAMDADCGRVYAASAKELNVGTDAMWHVPISGGNAKLIPSPDGDNIAEVMNIGHNDTHVFWTYARGIGTWQKDAMTSTKVMLTTGFKPVGLAVTPNSVYWSEYNAMTNISRIRYANIANGVLQLDSKMLSYTGRAGNLGIDQDNLYWINQDLAGGTSIMYISRTGLGAMPETILIPSPSNYPIFGPIVVNDDSQFIYFLTDDNGPTTTYRTTKPGNINPTTEEVPTNVVDEYWLIGDKKRLYLVTPKNGDAPEYGQIDWVNR